MIKLIKVRINVNFIQPENYLIIIGNRFFIIKSISVKIIINLY